MKVFEVTYKQYAYLKVKFAGSIFTRTEDGKYYVKAAYLRVERLIEEYLKGK